MDRLLKTLRLFILLTILLVLNGSEGFSASWNTFLGGESIDLAWGMFVDDNGNIFITGHSYGTWGSPVNPYTGDVADAFVAKLDANGVLQWNTFLGGIYNDFAYGICVDGSGNIYITGHSFGTWGSPINPYIPGILDNYSEAFVAKLNSSGALQWNTFMGCGDSWDYAYGISIDASANVYINGHSRCPWGDPLNPTTVGNDAFIAKLNANGILQWNTFLGGMGSNEGQGIVADASGNIFVTGSSSATWGNPVIPFHESSQDAYVAKFSTNGILQWNTFLGSDDLDDGIGISLDADGNVYCTGESWSAWGSPVNPYTAKNIAAFVAKLNASGDLQWNTFLGGKDNNSTIYDIAVDGSGNGYVAGSSETTWGSPIYPFNGGTHDAFVAKLDPNGTLNWHAFYGGNYGLDGGTNISAGNDGIIYFTGYSASAWGEPIRPFSVGEDAFVAKLDYQNISGAISAGGDPLPGVTMNGLPGSPLTDASGIYSTAVDYDWSGTVTPTLAGYFFSPADRAYAYVTADQTAQGYSASLMTYSISGTILFDGSPLAGVAMIGLPGVPVTDAAGFYTGMVTHGWAGTVTPSRRYFAFTPAATAYSGIASSQIANYDASLTQSLVVDNPDGTSLWEKGKTYSITWLKQGTQNANVKIMLYKGTSTLVATLSAKTANDGAFDWLVPKTLATGSAYFIRVKTVDNLIKDDSDRFSIIVPAITVTAPTTGTIWVKNAVKTITWNKLGTQDANVKIQLYMGTTRKLDISLSAPNNGSFDWLIPSTLANGTYAIKVITLDGKVTGVSKAFAIANGMIKVTAPATGAKWFRGMAYDIAWTWEGAVSANVKIQLFQGTALVKTITGITPNDGDFEWTIPASQAPATDYKVRVSAVDNLVKADSGKFSIAKSVALALAAPNGGQMLRFSTGQ